MNVTSARVADVTECMCPMGYRTDHKAGIPGLSSVRRVMVTQSGDLTQKELKTHPTNVSHVQGFDAKIKVSIG